MTSVIPDFHYPSKPFKLLPYQPQTNWIQRHVQWLAQDRTSWWSRIGIRALEIVESTVLASTGVGLLFLYQGWRAYKRIRSEEHFFEVYKQARPPSPDKITHKMPTRAFNHVYDVAIENEVIWYRFRQGGEWKKLYFDGYERGDIPTRIQIDGANLHVQAGGKIYYKKALHEYRVEQILHHKKARRYWPLINPQNDTYVAVGKIEKNNWKDRAFTLPIVNHLYYYNPFQEKRFCLPPHIMTWSSSHLGYYVDKIEDELGQSHVIESVTTLFCLKENRKDILEFDPWSPPYAETAIYLPEKVDQTFEAMNMDSSGSMVMIIGYEIRPAASGLGVTKRLRIKTQLVDIDIKGWNPLFTYSYFKQVGSKNVRAIPLTDDWQDHALRLEDGSPIQELTQAISIFQIGEGHNRELRVIGKKGLYFKHVNEPYWHFEPGEDVPDQEPFLPLMLESSTEVFETTIHNYKAVACHIQALPNVALSAQLLQFGLRSFNSTLQLKIQDRVFDLVLHRKKTWKNFIGFKEDSYDLVIPECYHQDPVLLQAFGKNPVIPVQVDEQPEQVIIRSSYWHPSFQFIFKVIAPGL